MKSSFAEKKIRRTPGGILVPAAAGALAILLLVSPPARANRMESVSYLVTSSEFSAIGDFKAAFDGETAVYKLWDIGGQSSTIGDWAEYSFPHVHGAGWAYTISLPIFWDKDRDRDGMPTFFEEQFAVWTAPDDTVYYMSDFNPDDAVQDWDGDGFTNIQEYLARTDPTDDTSFFQFTDISLVTVDGIPNLWSRTPTIPIQGMLAEYPDYFRSLSYEILYADWPRQSQAEGFPSAHWFNLTGTWTVLTDAWGEFARFRRQDTFTAYTENLAGLDALDEGDIRFYRLAIGGTWDQGEPVPHDRLSADWAYYTQVDNWRLASTLAHEVLMVQKHRVSPGHLGLFGLAGETTGSGGVFDHVLGTEYFPGGGVAAEGTNVHLWVGQTEVSTDYRYVGGEWLDAEGNPTDRRIAGEEGFRLRFMPEGAPKYPDQEYFYLSARLRTEDYNFEIPRHGGSEPLAWNDPDRQVTMVSYNLPVERPFLDIGFPRLAGSSSPSHRFLRWMFSDHVILYNRDISSRLEGATNATVAIYYYHPGERWEYYIPGDLIGEEVESELRVSPGTPFIINQFRAPDETPDDWIIQDSLPYRPPLTYLQMAVPEDP